MEVINYWSFALSTSLVFLLSFLFLKKEVGNRLAFWILVIKFSFFIIYYTTVTAATSLNLSDDIMYYNQSVNVFHHFGDNVFLLFKPKSLLFLSGIGGEHIGYFIYNCLAFNLFGINYYSPVLLNIFFSVLTGIILTHTLFYVISDKNFLKYFLLFFLVHWDVITWSSFINLKDIFLLFLTVNALYLMVRIRIKGITKGWLLLFILDLFVLYRFRFYMVYFMVLIFLAYYILFSLKKIKVKSYSFLIKSAVLFVIPVVFYFLFMLLFKNQLARMAEGSGGNTNVIIGSFRYITTPAPFNIDEKYYFLLTSSILHWCSFPFLMVGFYFFTKKYIYELMPFVLLFVLLSVFYGSFALLQEPRHRFVLVYFIAFLQFYGFYKLKNLKKNV